MQERKEKIDTIAEAFGIPLVDIIRLNEKYLFKIENGKKVPIPAEDCISQNKWRKQIAAGTQQIPDKKEQSKYDEYMQMIFDVANELCPNEKYLKNLISAYLEDTESDFPEAPRTEEGVLYIHLGDFRRFISENFDIQFNKDNLINLFSKYGSKRKTLNVMSDEKNVVYCEKRTTRSFWKIPPALRAKNPHTLENE